jgi:hypothetical protein
MKIHRLPHHSGFYKAYYSRDITLLRYYSEALSLDGEAFTGRPCENPAPHHITPPPLELGKTKPFKFYQNNCHHWNSSDDGIFKGSANARSEKRNGLLPNGMLKTYLILSQIHTSQRYPTKRSTTARHCFGVRPVLFSAGFGLK